jgi:hypothetical protein
MGKLKLITVFLLFMSLYSVYSKIYDGYASFEGCVPNKKCKFDKLQDTFAFYSRSVENPCSKKELDDNFFLCTDNYFLCGYVETKYITNSTEQEVSPFSGVHIANGMDLGELTEDKLMIMGVPSILVDRLKPMIGLRGKEALDVLLATNFTLTNTEGELLDHINKNYPYTLIEYNYNSENPAKKFNELPIEIRTSLVSLYRSNGLTLNDTLWSGIKQNDWDSVYDILAARNSDNPKNKLQTSLIYPHTSYGKNTNSSSFSVILMDITTADELKFASMKNFLVDYFVNHLGDVNKEHLYSVIFFHQELYAEVVHQNHTSAASIINKLDYNSYKATEPKRFTNRVLQKAMELIDTGLKDKFNITVKENNVNILTNIFLFSSGVSSESVEEVSKSIRSRGVNIYSFGVNYKDNGEELKTISEVESNIIFDENFSYENLKCYDTRVKEIHKFSHIHLGPGAYSDVQVNYNTTHYYKANLNPAKNMMLKAKLKDENYNMPANILNIFVSYLDPFPDRRTSDYIHLGTNTNNLTKLITIQGNTSSLITRNHPEERKSLANEVYIGIWSNSTSRKFSFELELSECDPKSCPAGTNDIEYVPTNFTWILVVLIILCVLFVIFFVFYLIRCYRKPVDTVDINARRTSNYHKLTTP